MEILKLPLKKRTSSIIWEHLLKTLAAAVVAWGVMIFGPGFIFAKSRPRSKHTGDLLVEYYKLMEAEPWIPISIVLLSCVVYNIYIYYQNSRSFHITEAQYHYDSGIFSFSAISHYSNRAKVHIVKREELKITVKKSNLFGESKKVLFNKGKKTFGYIYSNHEIWSSYRKLIMPTLHKIHDILYPDIPFKESEILSALVGTRNNFNIPLDFFRDKTPVTNHIIKSEITENGVEILIPTSSLFDFKKNFLVLSRTEFRRELRGKTKTKIQWSVSLEKIKEVVVTEGAVKNSDYSKIIFYDSGFRSNTQTINCHLKNLEKEKIEAWMKYIGLKISFLVDKHKYDPFT